MIQLCALDINFHEKIINLIQPYKIIQQNGDHLIFYKCKDKKTEIAPNWEEKQKSFTNEEQFKTFVCGKGKQGMAL